MIPKFVVESDVLRSHIDYHCAQNTQNSLGFCAEPATYLRVGEVRRVESRQFFFDTRPVASGREICDSASGGSKGLWRTPRSNSTSIAAWPLRNRRRFADGATRFRQIRRPCTAAKKNSSVMPWPLRRRVGRRSRRRLDILSKSSLRRLRRAIRVAKS